MHHLGDLFLGLKFGKLQLLDYLEVVGYLFAVFLDLLLVELESFVQDIDLNLQFLFPPLLLEQLLFEQLELLLVVFNFLSSFLI